WPEVWLAGLGWTHLFDPTPPVSAGSTGGSEVAGETGVPAAPQIPGTQSSSAPPQTVPAGASGAGAGSGGEGSGAAPGTRPPASTPRVSTTDEPDDTWWAVVVAVAGGLLALGTLYVVLVLLAKRRRRARRRDADPAVAIQGAWDEALDRLLEADVATD